MEQTQSGKELPKLDKNFGILLTILKGDDKFFKKTKVSNDDLSAIADELAREEKEAAIKRVKEKIINLIKRKKEYDNLVKTERAKFEKSIEEKAKEFNKEMSELLSEVNDVKAIEDSYIKTLSALSEEKPKEKESE